MPDTTAELSIPARIAVLRALSDEVRERLAAVRADAEAEFRAQREAGVKQLGVSLPGGAEVGTISIKAGTSVPTWRASALLAYAQKEAPSEVVERVDPAVLADPELIAWVLQHRPDMIRREVRDAYRTKLAKVLNSRGELRVESTGEVMQVATVHTSPPTGDFAYRPTPAARAAVMDAWRAGELGDPADILALPTAEQTITDTPNGPAE